MAYEDFMCGMMKRAAKNSGKKEDKGNIVLDWMGTGASHIVPSALAGEAGSALAQSANAIGTLTGLARQDKSVGESPSVASLIPGAATDRFVRRLAQASKPYGMTKSMLVSEQLGGHVSSLLAKLLVGAKMDTPNALALDAAGSVPVLLGGALAAVTPTRSKEQQKAYEQRGLNKWVNWLLPGGANYNTFKRIGRIRADEKAANKE